MTRSEIIVEAAKQIGTRPEWLDALINFETAGTYDPMKRNPLSSAKGLIQFINASARDLGYADSLSLVTEFNTFESQMMGPVIEYFKLKARQNNIDSYMTKQALYMAVFYPAYWDEPVTKVFPPEVRASNPDIHTPADYIMFVDRRVNAGRLLLPDSAGELSTSPPRIAPLLMLAGAGIGIFLLARYMR